MLCHAGGPCIAWMQSAQLVVYGLWPIHRLTGAARDTYGQALVCGMSDALAALLRSQPGLLAPSTVASVSRTCRALAVEAQRQTARFAGQCVQRAPQHPARHSIARAATTAASHAPSTTAAPAPELRRPIHLPEQLRPVPAAPPSASQNGRASDGQLQPHQRHGHASPHGGLLNGSAPRIASGGSARMAQLQLQLQLSMQGGSPSAQQCNEVLAGARVGE